jgi:hypothetical protein
MTLTACPSVCSDILGRDGGCVPVIESFQSRALAVGQCTIRAKYSVLRLVAKRDGRGFGDISEESVAVAVGQDEDPLPLVRRANFRRAENAPRRFITSFFQIADDCGESQRYVSFDILEEDEKRSGA